MKTSQQPKIKKREKTIFERVLEEKRVLTECIRKGGDLNQVAKEHDIKFATPV